MKRIFVGAILTLSFVSFCYAHFLVIKPSSDVVASFKQKHVKLVAKFTHPMEGGPDMKFAIEESGVFDGHNVVKLDWKMRGLLAYSSFKIKRPGVYQVYIVPKPYFEPQEGIFIKQITKVYIEAFGLEEGWDEPIGLDAEIVPLTRPFGVWVGNTFRGRAIINGKVCSNCDVEVEYLNEKRVKVPYDIFITQVVKTDENGYFEYTIPWAGWWGFSVLGEGTPIKKGGKEYPVELDAVLWIKAYDIPKGVK